jgi:hypothetical protein
VFNGTAERGTSVVIRDGNTIVDSFTQDTLSDTFTRTLNLDVGVHTLVVESSNVSGAVQTSDPLIVRIVPPVTAPTLRLDPAFDTGVLGDNITAASPTQFLGTADPGTLVVITDGTTELARFTQSAGTNAFARTFTLAPGAHNLRVMVSDNFGNTALSAPLTVTIDTQDLSPDLRYVRGLYTQILNRAGSLPEWTFWAQFLNQPNGRFLIVNAIESTLEARSVLVKGWYNTYLGRAAVGGEELFWANLIVQGMAEEVVLAGILSSDGYLAITPRILGLPAGTPPSPATYIQALYLQLLGRAASAADVNFWLPVFQTQGRFAVSFSIVSSVEHRAREVVSYYSTILNRPNPAPADVLFWANSGVDLGTIRKFFRSTAQSYFIITGFQPSSP